MAATSHDASLTPDQERRCRACNEVKPIEEFGRHASGLNGVRATCKACNAAASAAYRAQNRQEVARYAEAYRRRNRKRLAEAARERAARKREIDPEGVRKKKREWAATPQGKASKRSWRAKNMNRQRAYGEKRRSTPKGRVENSIRAAVSASIKAGSKKGRTFDLLGYSPEALMAHLERQFAKGMSWDNYGEWHIDHIVPLSAFAYETPRNEEFRAAWSLANLRPLWAGENIAKSAKRTLLL